MKVIAANEQSAQWHDAHGSGMKSEGLNLVLSGGGGGCICGSGKTPKLIRASRARRWDNLLTLSTDLYIYM